MSAPTPAQSKPLFDLSRSHEAFVRANRVIPGGVNSPARAFGAVGGEPPFMQRAEGAYLYDIDGHQYIDYIGSWGPMILGHGHPKVKSAVSEALELGTSFGAPTLREVEIAEVVASVVPSIEKVRFVSSGTEATMSAVRVARGVTGRDKVIKMKGHYHGHVDALLVQAGSAATTLGHPNSPGVTQGAVADTILCEFNDAQAVADAFAQFPGQIAAVLLEPVAGNMGLVPPKPGYLERLRELTEKEGAILLFDEVMTGFRLSLGGAAGAVRHHARPDGPRQDHRRRPARGGLRSAVEGHGPHLPGRAGLPGRDPLGEPAGDGRRAGDVDDPPRRFALRPARSPLGTPGRGARAGLPRRQGAARRSARWEHAHAVLPRRPGTQLRRRLPERHPAVRAASSGKCSPGACTCRAASSRPRSSPPRIPRPRSTTPSRPPPSRSGPSARRRLPSDKAGIEGGSWAAA